MFSEPILKAAQLLLERCIERNVRLVFAESCTGGLIAAAVTALPGSSRVVDRGFVVYSYESKEQELGIPRGLIEQHGRRIKGDGSQCQVRFDSRPLWFRPSPLVPPRVSVVIVDSGISQDRRRIGSRCELAHGQSACLGN